MFWIGFRDQTHSFIRVRLHTAEVITPAETRGDHERDIWMDERQLAFADAIDQLNLPLTIHHEKNRVLIRTKNEGLPFFCSWPDSFGPCQFEYNSNDPFEFLVPASRLAGTYGGKAATVRTYLTGFSNHALEEFRGLPYKSRSNYRVSTHCQLIELPLVQKAITPGGRLYASLCEFQTQHLLPNGSDAWAILGVVGTENGFRIEARFNRAPLEEDRMSDWLSTVLGFPVDYAPLSPFP